MADELTGKKIAFLATEGVEQVELTQPLEAVRGAGGEATLISLEAGPFTAFNHLDKADRFDADLAVADADASQYDGLVLPGGVANPDFLRADEDAMKFVAAVAAAHTPIAAICHAPWSLIETGIVNGRTLTSWPSLKTDIENAGGTWVDEEVVVDQGLTTSRNPDDIPAFNAKMIEEFCEGPHDDAPQPDGRFEREGAEAS